MESLDILVDLAKQHQVEVKQCFVEQSIKKFGDPNKLNFILSQLNNAEISQLERLQLNHLAVRILQLAESLQHIDNEQFQNDKDTIQNSEICIDENGHLIFS